MKKKKIIVGMIILGIIIIGLILTISVKKNKSNQKERDELQEEDPVLVEPLEDSLTTLTGETTFKYLKYVIDMYYEMIAEKQDNVINNMIDKTCGENQQVEKEMPTNYYINIEEIYRTQQERNLSTNVVKVMIIDKNTLEQKEETIIIRLDLYNLTFSFIPNEYIKDKENIKEGEKLEISNDRIEKNSDNTLEKAELGDYVLAEFYYNKLKELSLYDIEQAYKMLTDQYKTEVCETREVYQQMVESLFHEDSKVTDYKKRINADGETMIECKDSNNNTYIFIVKDGITNCKVYKKS